MLELQLYTGGSPGVVHSLVGTGPDIMAFLADSWSEDDRDFFEGSDGEAEDGGARKRLRVSVPVTEVWTDVPGELVELANGTCVVMGPEGAVTP